MSKLVITEEYLTLVQASKLTQVSLSSLKIAIQAGRLVATKPTRKIYVRREDLIAFMDRGKILPHGI